MAAGIRGLHPREATRLARDGPNALEEVRRRSIFQRTANMLIEPMFALLVAAIAIHLVLGDLGEGAMLGVSVLAELGSEIEVPSLENSVLLKIPVGSRHGQKLRLIQTFPQTE
jgi:Ca2+-transporting ATPase